MDTEITIDTTTMTLKQCMQAEVDAFKRLGGGGWQLKDFVLTHGREFVTTPLTLRGRRMAAKNCFGNAAETALSIKPWLIYCEGFVDAGLVIPIHHAWCVTDRGEVVDPTLTRKLIGGDRRPQPSYFGVPFRSDFLRRTLLATGTYGLTDGMSRESRDLILGTIQAADFLEEAGR